MSNASPPDRDLRLLLELGRGGMGVVYLALHRGAGGFTKLKVVKRLRPDLATEPAAVQMFLEEGRLSARLNHPNVVVTNEVGFDGKHYFLEMEYLEGQSLEALVTRASRKGGLAIPIGLWILAQALAGLHYAHELTDHDGTPLRVVHRDVSPHNVFVTYDGQVKVLDFGIAKAADSRNETQTGVVKGKVTYMAPEQVTRKPLDRRVDVFAAGVILWQLLAGERLWKDLDGFEIFLKLRSEPIPPPSSARPVDPALEAICVKALARDPADRFATALAMQQAIEAWLDAQPQRIGAREVAAAMNALFAEDRAAAKAEIEERIRHTPAEESAAIVPMLRRPPSIVTGTNAATASTLSVATRARVRGMRAVAFASVGIALVASVAAGVATWKRRAAAVGGAAGANADAAPGCGRNAECGAGEICRKDQRRCVGLATERCAVLAEKGDVENDRTIWIGAMFPTTGAIAPIGEPSMRAVDLARRDFVEFAHGIPSHSVDGAPRPLGVIACNDDADAEASAHHLADDVGVPAVIGFKTSAESTALARDVFLPKRVLVATTNQSVLATTMPQPADSPRLVWRAAANSTQSSVAVARVVSDVIEPRLRAQSIVSDAKPMRVALLHSKSGSTLPRAEALVANVRFNGKPARANGRDFAEIVYPDPTGANAKPDWSGSVAEIVARRPHVVVFVDEVDDLVDSVLASVEAQLPEGSRPYWVSTTNLRGASLFRFVGRDAARRRRFFGVSEPADAPANALLAARYSSEFDASMSTNDTPAPPYDAAYLVAYAAYVVGDAPMTGAALARAIERLLPPGEPIDVGPTHIFDAVRALQSGGNVDLNGAAYSFDYDVKTGEAPADYVIQCVGVDAKGSAIDAIDSGLVLEARTGTLRGAMRCP